MPASRLTVSRAGHAYALDGERIPSVTSIIGHAYAKPGLQWWAAGEAAQWAAGHVDLLALDGEEAWIKNATRAHLESRNRKAYRGTQAHADAQGLLSGEPVEIAAEYEPLARQAADFMDTWRVREIASERPCANVRWKYGGTFDLIAELADGRTWLLDWKTGKGPYAEQSLQLAGYASCDFYQDKDGNDQPMPVIERMGFVMLSDTAWDLVPVDETPPHDRETLIKTFACMVPVSRFAANTTRNSDGIAAWPVLGEPLPSSAAVA